MSSPSFAALLKFYTDGHSSDNQAQCSILSINGMVTPMYNINSEALSAVNTTTQLSLPMPSTTTSKTSADDDESIFELDVTTILWVVVNAILLVCILGGNTLTIIAIRTCRRLRAMLSNMFILSLAISDFTVGVALPFHVAFYTGPELGKSYRLCLLRFFLVICACSVSILTLIAIAVDRYIAIVYALHYRRYMTRRVALIIIAFNWLVGFTVGFVPIFWNHWSTAVACEFNEVLPSWYMVGLITPGFVVIWLFMLLIYWRIMREAAKQLAQMRCAASNIKNNSNKRNAGLIPDWKSLQVVVFIMGCFSICWLPYFVVASAQIFHMCAVTSLLYKAAFSLAMANSGLNPIIYCWKNSNFRRAFGRLLRCKNPNHYDADNADGQLDLAHCSVRSEHCQPPQSSLIEIVITPQPLDTPLKVYVVGGAGDTDCPCDNATLQN